MTQSGESEGEEMRTRRGQASLNRYRALPAAMSLRTVHIALRPALRCAASAHPSHLSLALLPSRSALASSPSPLPSLVRTKKTKAKKQDDPDYDPTPPSKGKGKKHGKGHMVTEQELLDTQLPGEQFELKQLEDNMDQAVDRLRVALKQVVGRVGRVSPGASLLPRHPRSCFETTHAS